MKSKKRKVGNSVQMPRRKMIYFHQKSIFFFFLQARSRFLSCYAKNRWLGCYIVSYLSCVKSKMSSLQSFESQNKEQLIYKSIPPFVTRMKKIKINQLDVFFSPRIAVYSFSLLPSSFVT